MNIGIDIGSTTLKVIVLDDNGDVVYKSYNRHKADIPTVFGQQLDKLRNIRCLLPRYVLQGRPEWG